MLDLQQFFVKERTGMFKTSNAYDILNPETQEKIGVAHRALRDKQRAGPLRARQPWAWRGSWARCMNGMVEKAGRLRSL